MTIFRAHSFIQKQIDRIAIVNLDEGIEIGNSRISYSGQLLKSVADYVYVGLNEAKAGLNADMYAAYIIIPADFSECIFLFTIVKSKNKTANYTDYTYKTYNYFLQFYSPLQTLHFYYLHYTKKERKYLSLSMKRQILTMNGII